MPRTLSINERHAFLAEVHVGVISISAIEPGRAPLAVPIWYEYDPDEGVSLITERTSRKGRAIEQAGRFTLVAQREEMPYTYVSVEGPVVASRPAERDRDVAPLARRYFGTQAGGAYAATFEDPSNVMYRYTMRPERWFSYTEADAT